VRLFIFESNTKTGLRAFVGDVAGRNLPDQFSPWRQIGAVAPGNAPPYKLSRDTIERPSALMAFSSGASNQRSHKARGLRLTRSRPAPRLFGAILVTAPLTNANSTSSGAALRNLKRRRVS
jgi:hypothetical protein